MIVAAFELKRGESIRILDFDSEADDGDVYSSFQVHMPDIKEHHYGDALSMMHRWIMCRIEDAHKFSIDPIIEYRDIRRIVDDIFAAVVKHGLMNYASAICKDPQRGDAELSLKQKYVEQMEVINLPDKQQVSGALDFLGATVNRQSWLEDESIYDDDVEKLETALVNGWAQHRENVNLTHRDKTDEEQGQQLYRLCMDRAYCRSFTICNREPLEQTIEGSFHMLANAGEIGWIKGWESMFPRREVF